jgi:uncharacterized protein YfaP (DUF2135 family)
MKLSFCTIIFFIIYYVHPLNGNCLPKISESTTKIVTEVQSTTTTESKETTSTTTSYTVRTLKTTERQNNKLQTETDCENCLSNLQTIGNLYIDVTGDINHLNSLRPRPYYSTTTTTPCPNQCWCGYSNIYNNNCECNCAFALSETPHVILTWDQIGTDLDLHVIDPNGEEIYYSHQSSSSGGKFFRDMQTGPNGVEFISWGLAQDGIKGPSGNYTVYVVAYRTSGQTPFNVAVLESPDQDWKYLNGHISNSQRKLVYQFNINNEQSSSLNSGQSANFSGVCELIYNADCECGFDSDCNCACQLVTRSTVSYSFDTTIYSTTTTTPCPNQCWCGYINTCECNCAFALSETPHVILIWDQIGTDLDLHVIDPNGEEIYYSHQSSSSGGKFLRDRRSGPNAVEFISWGLAQDGIKGPNGNYKIYVKGFSTNGQTPFNVAVLESPDQDWKYFNGEISYNEKQLVYQFNINNDQSSSLNSGQSANFSGVCALIYNADCECGFDSDCNCACQLVTRSTVSLSFNTASFIETSLTPLM